MFNKNIVSTANLIYLPHCKPRMALYGFDDTHLSLSSWPLLAFPELQYNGILYLMSHDIKGPAM